MTKTEGPVAANLKYGGEYRDQLERSLNTGECIFCSQDFQEDPTFFCLKSRKWIARRSQFPTRDAEGQLPQHHFLLLPRRHVTDWAALTDRDRRMMSQLIDRLRSAFQIKGGGLVHRLGDMSWSGATIGHLHVHFIVPRVTVIDGKEQAIPVYMPIG